MKKLVKSNSNSVAILDHHDGGAGQIASWFEEATGYRIDCFVLEEKSFNIDVAEERKKRVSTRVEFPENNLFRGRPFIVSMDWIGELKRRGITKVLPLTGDNRLRLKHIEMCRENGIELVSAIHPSVKIMKGVTIEPGVWINIGSIIGYKTEIKSGALIETGVQIDHHNVLEECCYVDPRVTTAGFATLRKCCYVHMGSTVINHRQIGEDAIVGAGAVVIKDVPPRCTVVGVPARVIKYHDSSEVKVS